MFDESTTPRVRETRRVVVLDAIAWGVPETAVDESADVIVGPSRHLPWPLDAVAHRSWDEAALLSRRFRHVLPVSLVQVLATSIELAQRPRLKLWRAATPDTRLVVAGNDPLILGLLSGVFAKNALERAGDIGRTRIRPDARFDADVVVLEIPSPTVREFARAGWLVLPRWVAMDVDLRRPERDLWDARKREIARRIERSSLELEVARGNDAADEFHRRMYAPTARLRHGKRAIVVRPAYVRAAVRAGFVLFVRSGGVRRAGLVVVPRPGSGRTVDALMFGVADGDYSDTKLTREAAYLFAIRWARDVRGALQLGLTGAAPFIDDGGLQFKKRWGATARADLRQAACIAVRVERGSLELCRALSERPVIALCSKGGDYSLSALVPRLPGSATREVASTPGIDIADLELESLEDLPMRLRRFAAEENPRRL